MRLLLMFAAACALMYGVWRLTQFASIVWAFWVWVGVIVLYIILALVDIYDERRW